MALLPDVLALLPDVLALLPDGRTPPEKDWRRVSDCWRDDLDARMTLLGQLRDELPDRIGCGCLSLGRCALTDPGDTLGSNGPGAGRLR
ncbi:MerR family DNA-binding protein [Micromonospora nigra]|uniref:MerR family DNA-binding protein n=1 Tax=Micromonospora nigra TaxID=145857 RepID=UPI001FE125CE|nr:MerR family DNA-binding protein [Micromonospora nigra]